MVTVSAIDKGHLGPLVCEGLDLFQRLGQRVAIMGIARQRPYPDHKAAPVGRSHADPGAKLVALVRLAPGNAVHRRFMQTVELFPVFRLLSQQPVHQRDHLFQVRLQPALRNLVQLPLDVAQHPTSVALEPAQRALRIRLNWRQWAEPPNLTGRTRGQAAMALPRAEPGLSGQPDQFAPCRLKQSGIRWMGNVLFHHRGIHGDPLEVAALHCTRPLPGFNRLGQHPLDTFLADPISPAGQGGRVNRLTVLKECLPAEMLPVRGLHPAGHDGLA